MYVVTGVGKTNYSASLLGIKEEKAAKIQKARPFLCFGTYEATFNVSTTVFRVLL